MIEQFLTTKLKNIGYILAFLIGSVGLPHEAFIILAALMVLDTASGIARVGVVHGWRHVKSARLTAGIISKLFVVMVPVIIAWTGKGAGLDLKPLAQGALSMIILAEAYSVLGNIYAIRIKKDVQEWDALAFVLKSIRQGIERIITSHEKK